MADYDYGVGLLNAGLTGANDNIKQALLLRQALNTAYGQPDNSGQQDPTQGQTLGDGSTTTAPAPGAPGSPLAGMQPGMGAPPMPGAVAPGQPGAANAGPQPAGAIGS